MKITTHSVKKTSGLADANPQWDDETLAENLKFVGFKLKDDEERAKNAMKLINAAVKTAISDEDIDKIVAGCERRVEKHAEKGETVANPVTADHLRDLRISTAEAMRDLMLSIGNQSKAFLASAAYTGNKKVTASKDGEVEEEI